MATKAQILDYVRTKYLVGESILDHESMIVLNFQTGDGRKQHAFVSVQENFSVFSPFAKVGQVSADKVFKTHEGMDHGLRLVGDKYCILSSCPIKDLNPSEIDNLILNTAFLADEMEKKLKLGDNF